MSINQIVLIIDTLSETYVISEIASERRSYFSPLVLPGIHSPMSFAW